MFYPEWSDLSKVGPTLKNSWNHAASVRADYRRYFEGDIFTEKVPVASDIDGDPPLMYPVGVNLVRMICLAQADALFGEWDDQIFKFNVNSEEVIDGASKEAIAILADVLSKSNGNSVFWEVDVDRNAYGGCPMKISLDLATYPYVFWQRVPLDGFYPVPDPDNDGELLEVYLVVDMTADQARIKYGITSTREIVQRVEHWTRDKYTNHIDGVQMDAFSGQNPWGFIPFVYIPRMRTSGWWGDALTPEVQRPQDELNATLADIGEAINYNSHPTRYGINLPRAFNGRNFPLGVNAFWDLGRAIGSSPKPEVGMMEAKNPVPPQVFEYVRFIYDWTRTSSFAPAVVFGEDSGGAQRSSATIELRMWPLIKYTRRSRAYMSDGIRKMIWMTGKILKQKAFSNISRRAVERMIEGKIMPTFAEVLPPDHQAIVDEVVKLLSTEPKSISEETAQKILQRGSGEVERIKQMYTDFGIETPKEEADRETKQAEDQARLKAGQGTGSGGKGQSKAGDQKEALLGKTHPQAGK